MLISETNPPPSPRRPWRSVGAVLLGFVVVVLTHTVTDVVMHATGIFPGWGKPMSDTLFLLATAYRTVFTIFGSYITARFAPYRPMMHAIILGAVGVVMGTLGAMATWNLGLGPHWYPVALVVLALPSGWVGGWIYERTSR